MMGYVAWVFGCILIGFLMGDCGKKNEWSMTTSMIAAGCGGIVWGFICIETGLI
jgi:membrane protein DedA with SNARE-associated domain